jgi:cellulose synthase/poly-beta-1,6-N-acetylglucosamine synthase-like glycosyltransferase
MVITPWYDTALGIRRLKNRKEMENYTPKVSVLVPAWNEEVGLLTTIESILKSSYQNYEVVVVNDGSTDNSNAMMKEYLTGKGKHHAEKIIYHYQENGGKGSALNTAVHLSHGEILMSIDADCEVDQYAIENFVKHFADQEVKAAVGNVKIGNVSTFVGMAQYLEFLFSFYFKKADSVLGSIYIIGGAAGAFRREVFEKLGGYHEHNITEDIELTVRIQAAGMKIVYAADAIVYTEGANDIAGLKKQRLRWKRGRLDTFLRYRKLFFSTRKKHNTFLTWFAMPFAVFGDLELLFEIPFISFIILLAFLNHDFTPFIGTMIVVAFVFFVQMFSTKNRGFVYLLAPIGWLIFMVITFIELHALVKSLKALVRGENVVWQRWNRQGVK